MKSDDLNLQMLSALKRYGESSTKTLGELFREFESRKELSAFLGNLKRDGLIAKNNPGMWSLTGKGRDLLEGSRYPLHEVPEEFIAPAEHQQAEVASSEAPGNALQLLGKLQDQVPENASLVIERNDLFFVVAGQKFEIRWPGDFEAMTLVADRYIGQVA